MLRVCRRGSVAGLAAAVLLLLLPGLPATAGVPVAPVVDASTPDPVAVLNNVSTTTSPLFSPPAGTVLEAAFSMDSASYDGQVTRVLSVANTGTPLGWHLLGRNNSYSSVAGGFVEVWWASNPRAQQAVTVTGRFSQPTKNVTPPVGDFQVLVLDHAAADQSAAAWHANTLLTAANNTPESRVSTTAANSRVFGVFDNWNNSERPVPESDQQISSIVLNTDDVDGYWVQQKVNASSRAGSSVLMKATDPGMATQWRVLAWEVLAG